KPWFENVNIIDEDLSIFKMSKPKLFLNRPIHVGFAILELSKLLMYQHHYDLILPIYGPERLDLCFTDTDSLAYHIKTVDMYEDMLNFKSELDTTKYPDFGIFSKLRSNKNDKVLGKLKD